MLLSAAGERRVFWLERGKNIPEAQCIHTQHFSKSARRRTDFQHFNEGESSAAQLWKLPTDGPASVHLAHQAERRRFVLKGAQQTPLPQAASPSGPNLDLCSPTATVHCHQDFEFSNRVLSIAIYRWLLGLYVNTHDDSVAINRPAGM